MPSGILELPVPPLTPPSATQPVPTIAATSAYTPTPYTATPYTVAPEGLVQEQVLKITGQDSPLMQAARTKANMERNARGLLNSTTAIQAGQEAVIAQALPIAQADAGAHNAAMTNTANQVNAAAQFNAGAQTSASQFAAGTINTAGAQNLQAASNMALAKLDASTKMELATLDTQNRQLLQSSSAASSAYVQAVTNISNISQSNTLSKEAKDAAINTQINLLRQQLSTIGGIASTEATAVADLDLGQYFQISASDGGAVVPGTPGQSPYNGSIPTGGSRDAAGNVFNADGTPAGWQGPPGQASGAPPGGTAPGAPTSPKPTRSPTRSDIVAVAEQHKYHNRWAWVNNQWTWLP